MSNTHNAIFYNGTEFGGGGATTAADTSYDNTESGLAATNTQDAIDEVQDEVETVNSKIDGKTITWESDTIPVNLTTTLSQVYSGTLLGSGLYSIRILSSAAKPNAIQVVNTSQDVVVANVDLGSSSSYNGIGTTFTIPDGGAVSIKIKAQTAASNINLRVFRAKLN